MRAESLTGELIVLVLHQQTQPRVLMRTRRRHDKLQCAECAERWGRTMMAQSSQSKARLLRRGQGSVACSFAQRPLTGCDRADSGAPRWAAIRPVGGT